MARLIDADKADVENIFCYYESDCYVEDVQAWLDEQPTVDAVEVVRCKDCKHYVWDEFDGAYVCLSICKFVKPDFWCAYRERRTDG